MGHQNRRKTLWDESQPSETHPRLFQREAAVDQQAHTVERNQRAITTAATAERCDGSSATHGCKEER